jgi:hypothetical protein
VDSNDWSMLWPPSFIGSPGAFGWHGYVLVIWGRIKPDHVSHEILRAPFDLDEDPAHVLTENPKADHVHSAEE